MDNREIEKKKHFLYYQGDLNDMLYQSLMDDRTDPETGEIIEAGKEDVLAAIAALQGTAAEVAMQVASLYQEIDKEADNWDEVEKRAHDEKMRRRRKCDMLKGIIAEFMDKSHIERTIGMVRLSFRNTQAVSIDNEADLPDEFWRIKKEPDKVAIKDAIKSGHEVPGASLQTNRSLQIK